MEHPAPAPNPYTAWTAYMLVLRQRGRIWVRSINQPATTRIWCM